MKLLKIIREEDIYKYDQKILKIRLDDDEFYNEVSSGKIDLFSHVLTVEEMEDISFDFRDLNLKNEYRYINLFVDLFNLNKELLVKIDYKELNDYEHLNILEELDRYEKHLWVNQMIMLNNNEVTDYFIVDDVDVLKMLVQINIREREFMEFHFIGLDVAIRGSFDCSMSIYSRKASSVKKLEPLVRNHDLFIRSFIRGEDT
jgi:hypothetical protein